MAQVNVVQKKIIMSQEDIIKYQLMTYCFLNDIQFSNNELDCLTLLGIVGEQELSFFCNTVVESKIFKTSQTVRNFLTKAENMKFIKKEGTNKKKIVLNQDLSILTSGNILLDIKIAHVTKKQ